MKKSEQIEINKEAICALDGLTDKLHIESECIRLDSCQAWIHGIYTRDGQLVGQALVSYNTMVAFEIGGIMYDVLRYVYGYTATSAKHISKFKAFVNPSIIYTYKPI